MQEIYGNIAPVTIVTTHFEFRADLKYHNSWPSDGLWYKDRSGKDMISNSNLYSIILKPSNPPPPAPPQIGDLSLRGQFGGI